MVGRSNPQFVKDGERGNQDEPDVNQWGVYNAYKWLMWKAHLTYKLWEIRARKNKKTPPTPESFHPQPGGVFSPVPRKQMPLSPGNYHSNPDGGFPQVSTNERTKSQDSSRSKADWDVSSVSEQQNLTNQVSLRSQPHSSYSPTPRQDIQNPESVHHEPGQIASESQLPENQSPVPGNQKPSKSLQGTPAQPLSPFKFTDSEIENEERNSRLGVQNGNVSPEPVMESKVVTISSGENTETVSFNKIN